MADDLVFYWELDETSGSRADSVGSNTLTDNNTVLYQNTGPQGVVAEFTAANSKSLSISSQVVPTNTSFTVIHWLYIPTGAGYRQLQDLVWSMVDEMFSDRVVTPGKTRPSELVWWWRQRLNDLGLGTWFQPDISVQRQGVTAEALGEDPVIERGDVLWCDVGITALRLNTDTQHNAYVLRAGETEPPAGLRRALANANRLQDIVFEEVLPGRTGNEILAASLAKMRAEGLTGTLYSHTIGMNGHGAGPLIGLWDYQEGVPGRGDFPVSANMWFSSELQVTTPVPEWGGQPVRMISIRCPVCWIRRASISLIRMQGEACCCSAHACGESNLGEDRLAARNSFFVLDLGNQPRHGYVIGSRVAESEPAYSPLLDVGFNRQDYIWRDDTPHLHTGSEEYFIVLRGRLDLLVQGCPVSVDPYQLVGVRANVPHQVIGGQAPITNFLIRVPGNRADKVSLDSPVPPFRSEDIQNGTMRINLRDPHEDYLLGACLPSTHANYSPLLDFTCVWGVEPTQEWRHEKLHEHRLREEYYFVLQGNLNFELDGSAISVNAGQILGVRPGAVHKVIGGTGPVDVLFVRVPGGRGDKTLLEA